MDAFDNKAYEQYKEEAKEKWGQTDAYREYHQKTKGHSQGKWQDMMVGLETVFEAFALCMKQGEEPNGAAAQAVVTQLQAYITEHFYTCTKQILAGLGQMYVLDDRFRQNIDKHADGTAQFAGEAIAHYCKN